MTTWTREKPREPGVYWCYRSDWSRAWCHKIEVCGDRVEWLDLDDCDNYEWLPPPDDVWWYGPLTPPPLPEERA